MMNFSPFYRINPIPHLARSFWCWSPFQRWTAMSFDGLQENILMKSKHNRNKSKGQIPGSNIAHQTGTWAIKLVECLSVRYQVMSITQLLLKMLGVTQRMLLKFKWFTLSSFNSPAALHNRIGRIASLEVGLNCIVHENIRSPQLPNLHAHCA